MLKKASKFKDDVKNALSSEGVKIQRFEVNGGVQDKITLYALNLL